MDRRHHYENKNLLIDRIDKIRSGELLMNYIRDCILINNKGINKNNHENKSFDLPEINKFINFQYYHSIKYVNDEIDKLPKSILNLNFLKDSFNDGTKSKLLSFNEHGYLDTILTYFFNDEKNCVEIHAFRSIKRGGIILNYFINSVKCAFKMLKQKFQNAHLTEFPKKICLDSINDPGLLKYYEKFNFKDDDGDNDDKPTETIPIFRNLTQDSVEEYKTSQLLLDRNISRSRSRDRNSRSRSRDRKEKPAKTRKRQNKK